MGDIHRRWLASLGGADDPVLTGDDRAFHRPGSACRRACLDDHPAGLVSNRIEVRVGRRASFAGDLGLGSHCPSCGAEQTGQNGDRTGAVTARSSHGTGDTLACHARGFAAPLPEYRFDPIRGFGRLGSVFADWRLGARSVAAFAERLGHDVVLVRARV